MRIASLTVVLRNGTAMCANNLTVAIEKHPDADGMRSVLMFICSGQPQVIPVEQIHAVQFHQAGAQHCNNCDQSLYSVIGVGIAANNPPVVPGPPNPPKGQETVG